MATQEHSTVQAHRQCKTCGVEVGKIQQRCELCRIEKKKAKERRSYEKKIGRPVFSKPLNQTIVCLQCGKEHQFSGWNNGGGYIPKFCSSSCRARHWRENSPLQTRWEYGGKKYTEKSELQKQRLAINRENDLIENPPHTSIAFKKCACGASFVDHSKMLDRVDCVWCAGRKLRTEINKNDSRLRKCKQCGVEFSALYGTGNNAYCSDECKTSRHKIIRAKHKKEKDQSYANHLRRIRRRNAKAQAGDAGKFKRIEIFERDKWICKLCGKKVDKKEKYPSPGSATIDHIVPVACGGLHTRENTQLAHNKCNYTKQHTGFGGQIWLIG